MKKLAFAALFVGALGLVACGGGGDDGPSFDTDGGGGIDSGPGAPACNPITQQGCAAGEKCASKVESAMPLLSRTACVPNGSVPPGGMCTASDAGTGPDQGIDDCQAAADTGYECINGACTEVCGTTPNSCSDGLCVTFEGLFEDVENAGACAPTCNAVAQDCPVQGQACYYNFFQNGGVCAGVPMPAADLGQGDTCYGPQPGSCYLNGCGLGFGPNVPEQRGVMGTPFACAKFCTPQPTDVDNAGPPEGLEDGANAQYSCASPAGAPVEGPDAVPNATLQCRFFNSFFIDTDMVPDPLGFCVPKDVWGDCLLQETATCLAAPDPEQEPACDTLEPGCMPIATFANGNMQRYKDILRRQGKAVSLPEDLRNDLMDRAGSGAPGIH